MRSTLRDVTRHAFPIECPERVLQILYDCVCALGVQLRIVLCQLLKLDHLTLQELGSFHERCQSRTINQSSVSKQQDRVNRLSNILSPLPEGPIQCSSAYSLLITHQLSHFAPCKLFVGHIMP